MQQRRHLYPADTANHRLRRVRTITVGREP
jgi:hypothetical protein